MEIRDDYHLMFKLSSEQKKIVRQVIKEGLFKKDKSDADKLILLNKLNKELCSIYGLEKVKLKLIPDWPMIGSYRQGKIIINKISLVTYLHEFYHYFALTQELFAGFNLMEGPTNNSETNARGFSHSLYYQAAPNLFRTAVEKGMIMYQTKMKEDN